MKCFIVIMGFRIVEEMAGILVIMYCCFKKLSGSVVLVINLIPQ